MSSRSARSTASSSSASHPGSYCEPLVENTGSGSLSSSSTLSPLIYVCISCEGVLRAEAALQEVMPMAKNALRAAAFKAERGLQRSVSFASKEEKLARGARCGAEALSGRLPACLTVHVLRRHGHAICVLTLPGFEADYASRFSVDFMRRKRLYTDGRINCR